MKVFFDYLMDEQLVRAIYLALFHSLWQAALIAAIAGMIMIATPKANSKWRYNLLLGSLLLFVVTVIFTFTNALEDQRPGDSVTQISAYNNVPSDLTYSPVPEKGNFYSVSRVVAFFNTNSKTIVSLWFLVICFKCFQLLSGLSRVFRLKREKVFPVGDYWEQLLKGLATQLGITQHIKFMQSGLIQVPLTLGYFKPLILIPAGLLTAIPQEQIEAILLHELAHIRRKDYLVNIFHCLVEILFFFNPAIWWLSSLLRAERENCCDDLAVSRIDSKWNYIEALIVFEEYKNMAPAYTSAITGTKNHLLNRAKRLINNHNKTLNPMEKIILISGLMITCSLTFAFTRHIQHKPNVSKTTSATAARTSNGKNNMEIVLPATKMGVVLNDYNKPKTTVNPPIVSMRSEQQKAISQEEKLNNLLVDLRANLQTPETRTISTNPIRTIVSDTVPNLKWKFKIVTEDKKGIKAEYNLLNDLPADLLSSFLNQRYYKSMGKFKIVTEDENGNKNEFSSLDELPVNMRTSFLKQNQWAVGIDPQTSVSGVVGINSNKGNLRVDALDPRKGVPAGPDGVDLKGVGRDDTRLRK